MLPARHRLRRRTDFRAAMRGGRRAGRRLLVAHLYGSGERSEPRVGFVVGKSVGGAVVRNAVRRRLRHLAMERVDRLPAGGVLVVRALPGSVAASSTELGADLDAALERLVKVEGGGPTGGRGVRR